MEEQKPQGLALEIKPEIAKGTYSNLAVINHSRTEFVIDFAGMLPGLAKPEVVSRVIMNPEHVKRLLMALNENVGKYEQQFGRIDIPGQNNNTFNLADFNPNGAKS